MEAALIIGGMFSLLATFQLWSDRKGKGKGLRQASPLEPIQRQITTVTPRTSVPKPKIYTGDMLEELAQTTLHILFGVMSGAGKSTSMKAIIWKIHQNNPEAQFIIIDPKTTDWLGLQLKPNVVHYLSGEVLNQLCQLRAVTEMVYTILDTRISAGQELLKLGRSLGQPEHDIYLIIDEWFALYDAIKKMPGAFKAEFKLNDILLHLNGIIAKGREHKIHLFMVAQSHLAGETGISTAMRRSIALVGQGRLSASGDGGYASVQGIIKDANVFRDSGEREYLMSCLNLAIAEANEQPVIVTTMGIPRVGLLPDLNYVHELKIS